MMLNTRDRDDFLASTVIKLLKRNAVPNLRRIIAKTHSADIAHWFPHLRPDEKPALFNLLVKEKRMSEVLGELHSEERNLFFQSSEPTVLVEVLKDMPPDDVSDTLADLPLEQRDALLRLIKGSATHAVEQILQYDEKTAGYIMNPHFFALPQDITASAAVERIREMADLEMVFYVYVVDEENRLKGVLSLRQLVTTRPNTLLKDLMTTRVYTVHTTTLQEEVARVVARYNLLAVPVVDEDNKLVGIVTVDDVVDVIREENTEDMLKMAGTGDVDIGSKSILKNTRARLPWLFASWISGIAAGQVIGLFQVQLEQLAVLAVFIPIIAGMGGNVGLQSATIVVRGLATGEVNLNEVWQILRREAVTGITLGCIYGLLLGLFARFRYWNLTSASANLLWFPLVVALSIRLNMTLAATVGTVMPMLFKRLRIDPAIATGPFVTASLDVIGNLSYFLIAGVFLF